MIFNQEEEKIISKIKAGLGIESLNAENEKITLEKVFKVGDIIQSGKNDRITKHGKFFYRLLLT